MAGLMFSTGGGGTTASVGTSVESAAGQRAVQAKNTSNGRNAARKGNEREAWKRMGLRRIKNEVRRDLSCVAQSYGEVQEYFLSHPCKKLQQKLFPVADAEGNVIAVSVMWVRMPSRATASGLKRVEDEYGTGDVTPVGTQLLGFGGFRFTGEHYDSDQDGTLLTIAETEPVSGHPTDTLLDGVASVAVALPPP
ncbi:hypothetical protein QFW96_22295 [Saccharopolyspora sp. TS4A08]|uniref:Uncharacterized protein n=1 Tax=Saccharopolyspora ipomoeae TaxID=3042027 RepID=A0ABT6PVC7_9PSEU|nr:hypothetical protein [Saccharopolyspora sp. TS4A08]MDI2031376.1 hypothetical protein [Saccharopolyspora sp. TS4A08]